MSHETIPASYLVPVREGKILLDVFFSVKKWTGEFVNMEPDKCEDLSWFDLDKLPANVIPYVGKVIEHIGKKVFYSEDGW